MPSSSGAMRAKFIGVEHFGQAGRMIVRGIDRISGIALPSCYRREFFSGFLNGHGRLTVGGPNDERAKERPELGRFRGSEDCG